MADFYDNLEAFCLTTMLADCQCISHHFELPERPICDPRNLVEVVPAIRACEEHCICPPPPNKYFFSKDSLAGARARQGLARTE